MKIKFDVTAIVVLFHKINADNDKVNRNDGDDDGDVWFPFVVDEKS